MITKQKYAYIHLAVFQLLDCVNIRNHALTNQEATGYCKYTDQPTVHCKKSQTNSNVDHINCRNISNPHDLRFCALFSWSNAKMSFYSVYAKKKLRTKEETISVIEGKLIIYNFYQPFLVTSLK